MRLSILFIFLALIAGSGYTFSQSGKPAANKKASQAAATKMPASFSEFQHDLMSAVNSSGDDTTAVNKYLKAVYKKEPGLIDLLISSINTTLQQNPEENAAVLNHLSRLLPGNPEVWFLLAETKRTLSSNDKFAEQKDSLQLSAMENYNRAIGLNYKSKDRAYLGISQVYSDRSEYNEAIFAAQKAVEMNAGSFDGCLALSKAYFDNQQYPDAQQAIKKAIINRNNTSNNYGIYESYMMLIESSREAGLLDEALEIFKQNINDIKKNNEQYGLMGYLYMTRKEYKESIDLFLSLLEKEPNHYHFLVNTGLSYGALKDNAKAIEYFDRAQKLNQDNSEPHYFKAQIYLQDNKKEMALEQYNILLKMDNGLAEKLKEEIDTMLPHEKK